MPEEKTLTEKESLELIASMINKAKNSYIESGIGPLYWGSLITFCCLVNFAEINFHFNPGFDIWGLSFVALVPQVYFMRRSRKQKNFTSHDDVVMNFVWGTFALCIFMLTFYVSQTHAKHQTALFMMIYGMPTFITGGMRKFTPMLIGGMICWICSIASFYMDFSGQILLMTISATSAWLVPGIILRRRYLKLKNV